MKRIAKFEKVSLEEFTKMCDEQYYEDIPLPARATSGSAGYDFYLPFDLNLKPHEGMKIPTAIRVRMKEGWLLQIFPRSSLGFKYRLQLDNTAGIIDSDYYRADNEGHIIIALTNNGDREISLKKGDRFAQGIFVAYGITEDDEADSKRTGGFGSTDKKK